MKYSELIRTPIKSTEQVCVWYRNTWCGRFRKGVLPSRKLITDLIVSSGFYICEVNTSLDLDINIRFTIVPIHINPLKPKTIIYFDMDGVLADFNTRYIKQSYIKGSYPSLHDFSKLPKEEKDQIKEDLFTYDFFRHMWPLSKGIELLKYCRAKYDHVVILSAVGSTSHTQEIERAKRDWLKEHVGEIDAHFVNKTENKFEITKLYPDYQNHILIDAREKSVDPWITNGGIGILHIG